MKRFITIAFYISTLFWAGFGVWIIWPMGPPLVYLPGDTVSPKIVKAGGVITITRNIQIFREEPVTVVRSLVTGDCKLNCEIVDLPSSSITVAPSDHRIQSRDLTLPATVQPGNWTVRFRYLWIDRAGRTHSEPIPELFFTVVDK